MGIRIKGVLPSAANTTAEAALTSVTLVNESGSPSPADQPYTFGAVFEPGKVFSDGHVEVQFAGSPIVYQQDREVRRHPDGSLSRAVFSVRAPSVMAGGTAQINLVARAGSKPTGSVGIAAIQSADYSTEMDVSGTTWTAAINDAITAGDYETTRDGPVATRIRAYRKLNDGTSNHADLWMLAWATSYADGSTDCMAWVINGYVADAANISITEVRLLAGASVVWSYNAAGSGFSINPHALVALTSNGLPYRTTAPTIYHRIDRAYVATARAWWQLDPPGDASAGAPTDIDYAPGNPNVTGSWSSGAINSGGDGPHIGYLPNWTSRSILSGSSAWQKRDRVNALAWLDIPIVYYDDGTGRIPVLTQTDHTNDGLSTSYPSTVGYGINASVANTGTRFWSNPADGTHNPEPFYWLAIEDGDEWWDEGQIVMANNAVGQHAGGKVRSPWDGVVIHHENRAWGWNLRTLVCVDWLAPDAAPERSYMSELVSENFGFLGDNVEGWESLDSAPIGGINRGLVYDTQDISIWQQSFWSLQVLLHYWRVQEANAKRFIDHHTIKWCFGQGVDGCFYNFGAYYLAQRDPSTSAWYTSWSEVQVTDAGSIVGPFIPSGGCPNSGLGNAQNNPIEYAVIGLGLAEAAQRVGTDTGHATLKSYAESVIDYVRPEVEAGSITDQDWADKPKYTVRSGTGYQPVPYSLPEAGEAVLIGTNNIHDVKPSSHTTSQLAYSLFGSYGSGTHIRDYGTYGAFVLCGTGGHNHPPNVDAVLFDYADATWKRLANANGVAPQSSDWSDVDTNGSPYFEIANEVPSPPHSYAQMAELPTAFGGGSDGSIIYAGRSAVCVEARNSPAVHRFDLATATWSRVTNNTHQVAVEGTTILDESTGRFLSLDSSHHNEQSLDYLDTAAWTWGELGSFDWPSTFGGNGYSTYTLDPDRRLLLIFRGTEMKVFDLDNPNLGYQSVTVSGATLPTGSNFWCYYPPTAKFYYMPAGGGSTLYRLTPPASDYLNGIWTVDTITLTGDTIPKYTSGSTAPYRSLQYVPSIQRLSWASGDSTAISNNNQIALIKPE